MMTYRKPHPLQSALATKMGNASAAVSKADRMAMQRRRAFYECRAAFAGDMIRRGEQEMRCICHDSELACLGRAGLDAWRVAENAAKRMVDAIEAFLASGGGSVADFERLFSDDVAAIVAADERLARVTAMAANMKSRRVGPAWGKA